MFFSLFDVRTSPLFFLNSFAYFSSDMFLSNQTLPKGRSECIKLIYIWVSFQRHLALSLNIKLLLLHFLTKNFPCSCFCLCSISEPLPLQNALRSRKVGFDCHFSDLRFHVILSMNFCASVLLFVTGSSNFFFVFWIDFYLYIYLVCSCSTGSTSLLHIVYVGFVFA